MLLLLELGTFKQLVSWLRSLLAWLFWGVSFVVCPIAASDTAKPGLWGGEGGPFPERLASRQGTLQRNSTGEQMELSLSAEHSLWHWDRLVEGRHSLLPGGGGRGWDEGRGR